MEHQVKIEISAVLYTTCTISITQPVAKSNVGICKNGRMQFWSELHERISNNANVHNKHVYVAM